MFPSSVQHASLLGSARAAAREEVEEVSHSFRDVFSVMGSKHSTTGQKSLLSSELNGASPPCVQVSENDLAEFIIVSEPEGTSLQMGGLHPRASLFERPVNMMQAQVAHAEFRQLMREYGEWQSSCKFEFGITHLRQHRVGRSEQLRDISHPPDDIGEGIVSLREPGVHSIRVQRRFEIPPGIPLRLVKPMLINPNPPRAHVQQLHP